MTIKHFRTQVDFNLLAGFCTDDIIRIISQKLLNHEFILAGEKEYTRSRMLFTHVTICYHRSPDDDDEEEESDEEVLELEPEDEESSLEVELLFEDELASESLSS